VIVYPTVPAETGEKITAAVKKILAKKTFDYLGRRSQHYVPGDSRLDVPLTVVHIDAHLDTGMAAKGNLDHASWVLRVAKLPR